MEFKQPIKTMGSLGVAAAAGLIAALALGSPAQAEVVTIPINPGNVPTTAAGFEDVSCENLPDGLPADVDGWVFVLPASAGADGNFVSVTATFEDEDGDERVRNTADHGAIVSGSGDNKAYIIAPAGWTLVEAEAEVNDPDDGAKFNLTHACPGEPGDGETTTPGGGETTTPGGGETTAPGEETTAPGTEPSSPAVCEEPSTPSETATSAPSAAPSESGTPCEEATTPAGSGNLPTTGTPLTIALVSAAALAAGGAALFMIQRRRREAQDW
ncbi:hypothetical protein K3N28_05485 [Glycomyces sp. TRM65418]|uniref:hypothetical protein n=1 Tax=Glycomyces sp. TRM65418 TaxID=2867006 RepID=UPI001CE6CFC9|nr:hypothetical protein [Glycomyces sp. TRM65418]MCC3762520.1 hypothetical protein [Glycomyces sp. TRM65418]QZD56563.1 hypothetical protein K3N28_05445 [Glycomyces sp. TRM65418]